MRVLLRGAGVAVLLWFAFAAAASKVRGGTVVLDRCVRLEPEWPEETGVPMAAVGTRHAEEASATDRRAGDATDDAAGSATAARAIPAGGSSAPGPMVIPLPAPLLSGTVGLLSVATALLLRRVRRVA